MNRFLRARCRQWQKGEAECSAVGLLDGVAAETGIIVKGVAVGSEDVTEALQRTTKTDLLMVANNLYIRFLFETEDDAAALLLDEFLTAATANFPELLLRALKSELTGDDPDGFSVQTCALCHFLIAEVGVFDQDKGTCVAVASRRGVLSQSETACVTAHGAACAADM